MIGLRVDGERRTDPDRRAKVTARRRTLRLAGLCINGGMALGVPGRRAGVVHGPANPTSGKCDRCEEIARRSR